MRQSASKSDKKAFPFSAATVARALNGRVTGNNEIRAPGPGHSDADDSMVITIDPSAPSGFLVHSHANDDPLKCKDYVRERLGLASWQRGYSGKPGTDYIYRDEHGAPYMKVTRSHGKDGKKFVQYRCENNDWLFGTKGIARVPYRLPELLARPTDPIYFVEGEKDADRLAAAGLVATTAPEGASAQWKPELTNWFKGRDIYILPDNDQPGRAHGQKVARVLSPVARSIKIVELPGLPDKGDVSDWLDIRGDIAELIAICESTSPFPANDNIPQFDADFGGPFLGLLTESDVASRFGDLMVGKLRYCHSTGRWYFWNGYVWAKDDKQCALDRARQLAHKLSEGADIKVQVILRKVSFARSIETFSRADQRLAVVASDWDRDPFKLGTPDGTVDLKTGDLLPADRADGITKSTAFVPATAPNCPTWIRFLQEATGDDAGLIRFLQQWCGYALTGDTSAHALVFVYGGGGNGKSVFLNTVSAIIGDYAVVAAMDTFTASKDSKHPTDLAMLRGARLVTASETEEGRAWAEARIKQLTGGDEISARFMRQDFFTFKPQFKLTVVGNHRPVLHNVDDAMRRRFNIIPFVRKPEKPDPELESKLLAEAPEILRWMIIGCLDWQANGFVRPEIVKQATEEYFDEQDLVAHWLDECCDVERGNQFKWETASALFTSWKRYAEAAGEHPGTAKSMASALATRGFDKKRITGGKTAYLGLRLKSAGAFMDD